MDINLLNSPVTSSSGVLCLTGGVFAYKHHPSDAVLAQLCCGMGCFDGMWCQHRAFSILSLPLAAWQHFLSERACGSRGEAQFFIPDASANGWSCGTRVHTFQEGSWQLWACKELLQGRGEGLVLAFHSSVWAQSTDEFFNSSTISDQLNKSLVTTETQTSTKAMVPQLWAAEQQLM